MLSKPAGGGGGGGGGGRPPGHREGIFSSSLAGG